MANLDLSKFKKLYADGGCTTLKHKDGHELRIAHRALSDKMRKELENLPMAEGGNVDKETFQEGVHHTAAKQGQSHAGALNEVAKKHPGSEGAAKRIHEKTLAALKGMKAPDIKGLAQGGETGVNKPRDEKDPGVSRMGHHVRSGPDHKAEAKDMAHKMLREMDRSPKPKIQGFKDGGGVDVADLVTPKFDDDAIAKAVDQAPATVRPSFGEDVGDAFGVNGANPGAAKQAWGRIAGGGYGLSDAQRGIAPAAAAAPASVDPDQDQDSMSQDQAPDQQPSAAPPQQQASGQVAPEAPQQQAPQDQAPQKPSLGQVLTSSQQPAEIKQTLDDEYQKAKADYASGQIKPETYKDLYAKKDTLGKIGTIFGLLVGGIGSGLTHQPNALMEMMNKEIDRDLDAQKNSKANQMNFLNAVNQHHMTESQIALQGLQGKETQANIGLIGQKTRGEVLNNAKLQAGLAALTDTGNYMNNLPDGPQKQKAMAAHQMMGNALDQQAQVLNAQSAQAVAERNWQAHNRAMSFAQPEIGKWDAEHHQPGIPGNSSTPLTDANREAISSGTDFDKKLSRFMGWTQGHSGSLSPSDRHTGETMAAELQGAYRQATHGGVYKEGEQNFISKLIDSEPTKFFNNIRVLPQLQALSSEHKARMNNLVSNLGFSGYPGASQGGQGPAGPQYKTVNGVKYMRGPNGEAVKVK